MAQGSGVTRIVLIPREYFSLSPFLNVVSQRTDWAHQISTEVYNFLIKKISYSHLHAGNTESRLEEASDLLNRLLKEGGISLGDLDPK